MNRTREYSRFSVGTRAPKTSHGRENIELRQQYEKRSEIMEDLLGFKLSHNGGKPYFRRAGCAAILASTVREATEEDLTDMISASFATLASIAFSVSG